MAAFSTVSLMRESPEIIGRFVHYYLAAGADEVMVFHDGPAPFRLESGDDAWSNATRRSGPESAANGRWRSRTGSR